MVKPLEKKENDVDDILNNLIDHFKKLNISNISVEEFKNAAYDCYESYKKNNHQIDTESIKKGFPSHDLVDVVLEFWSKKNKKPNPLQDKNNDLKDHDFFKNRKYVCAAPHTSLRFDMDGKMTVCCVNVNYPIGKYPENTPLEAWNGDKIKEIRKALDKKDFSKGCQLCAKFILAGNAHNTVLVNHDKMIPDVENHMSSDFPAHLVFQHYNTCNYECIMCGGNYSSLVARNREKTPRKINPYDSEKFIDDIAPFIPHAKIFEFLGGEPFLVFQNYKIWELIKNNNPTAHVSIISNGSLYNKKIENILLDLPNSSVNISIDAVTPEIYSYIRRNGDIKNVKDNILKLKKINRMGSLSICPMIQNIRDIPNVIKFCEKMGVDIWFNDVQYALGVMHDDMHENGNVKREMPLKEEEKPKELIKEFRLWTLPKDVLIEHINFLQEFDCPVRYQPRLLSFINYLKNYVANLNNEQKRHMLFKQ
jgi:MoaA/NifB/PqqE/SkfB family radical SAM enzyme